MHLVNAGKGLDNLHKGQVLHHSGFLIFQGFGASRAHSHLGQK